MTLVALAAALIPACGGGGGGGGAPGGATPGSLAFTQALYTVLENGGTVTITVSRTGGSAGAASVLFQTIAQTALGADFTLTSGLLSWPDGDATDRTFPIIITDDANVEGTETVRLLLSNPTGSSLGATREATLNIEDDDAPAAGVLQFTEVATSIDEGGVTATISVSRTGGTSGAVTVDFSTADGSATAGNDYTANGGTLAWADADGADQTFDVTITQDALAEGLETLLLSLTNVTGGAAIGTASGAVLTIVDDNVTGGYLSFEMSNFAVYETAGAIATITVTRTGSSTGAVDVDYATSNGTAGGTDYTTAGGTLSWADGDTAPKTFDVPVLDDGDIEGPETVNLSLTNPTNGAFLGAFSTAVLDIVDSEPTNGILQFTLASYTVSELGVTATISVSRTVGSTGMVTVDYATSDGSATAGSDYTAAGGTLTWLDGDSSNKTFDVTILDDGLAESDETVVLTLSNETGGAVIGAQNPSTLTITDDDSLPSGELSFVVPPGGCQVFEADGTITITVQRLNGSDGAITVNYATSNGSAKGADYVAAAGTLAWANGDAADKTFVVTIKNNDQQPEGDETFNVTLSAPTGGATLVPPSTTTVTIHDD